MSITSPRTLGLGTRERDAEGHLFEEKRKKHYDKVERVKRMREEREEDEETEGWG